MSVSRYLVCYDIRSNRMRTRLHKAMKDWGVPVQKSVFECILLVSQIEGVWRDVERYVNPSTDRVTLYRLDRLEDKAIRALGFYLPAEQEEELIIF